MSPPRKEHTSLDQLKKQQESKALVEAISKTEKFATDSGLGFDFYPFSNEKGLDSIISQLVSDHLEPTKNLRVALLFGESHILSMMHALSNYADVIVLADIEPKLHKHTKHMLKCLLSSDTVEEYKKNYKKDNPIKSVNFHNVILSLDQIADQHFIYNKSLVGVNYFLNSEEIFNRNKKALENVCVVHVNLNLGDAEQCIELANLIKTYGEIVLSNFSNIHDYFLNPKNKESFVKAILALLSNSQQCKVMYANGFNDGEPGEYLKCNFAKLQDYLSKILKYDVTKLLGTRLKLFPPDESKSSSLLSNGKKDKGSFSPKL